MKKMAVQKSVWHMFAPRKRSLLYVAMYTRGITNGTKKILGFTYPLKIYFFNGEIVSKELEFQRKRKLLLSRLEHEPRFLLKVMEMHYKFYHRHCLKLWMKIAHLQFKKCTNGDLVAWFHKYSYSIGEFWSFGMIPLFIEQDLTEKIEVFVKNRLPEHEAAQALQVFMTPKKEGIMGAEYQSLLRIATKVANKRDAATGTHRKKFSWIANQLYTHKFFSLSYYKDRVKKLSRQDPKKLLDNYTRGCRQHHKEFKYWLRKIRPDTQMKIVIESLNEAIFYRSWRGEKPYESEYMLAGFFEEIARRLYVTPHELLYFLPYEIEACLRGKRVDKQKIIDRQKGFCYFPTKNGKVLTGKTVAVWEQKVKSVVTNSNTLIGSVAYPGVVRGVVKVIKFASELVKINKGDVLVTPSTTPLYVPILDKVSAIITEEGGVLCHASVIARELRIPCVIGTKVATQVLKDGDLVEVDADKGVVKILN